MRIGTDLRVEETMPLGPDRRELRRVNRGGARLKRREAIVARPVFGGSLEPEDGSQSHVVVDQRVAGNLFQLARPPDWVRRRPPAGCDLGQEKVRGGESPGSSSAWSRGEANSLA